MSRATISAARTLAILAAALLAVAGIVLSLGTSPAQAAKPCWERVIDDWLDNDRIDGVYSARCLEDARKHLPEDVRAYSSAEEKIDEKLQDVGRSAQGSGGGGSGGSTDGGSGGSFGGTDEQTQPASDPEPNTGPRDEGPIQSVLGSGTTDASSIPLPLIILAALALLLMAAGAAGLIARKLQARRARPG